MTTYLIHAGTGTIIDADDDVYVVTVTAETPLDYDDDDAVVQLAMSNGKRLDLTDMTWGNTISYSPSSIRTEIRESLWEGYSDDDNDKAVLEWAEQASDDDLNEVASYILSADDVWQNFTLNLVDGLREGYRWSKEGK